MDRTSHSSSGNGNGNGSAPLRDGYYYDESIGRYFAIPRQGTLEYQKYSAKLLQKKKEEESQRLNQYLEKQIASVHGSSFLSHNSIVRMLRALSLDTSVTHGRDRYRRDVLKQIVRERELDKLLVLKPPIYHFRCQPLSVVSLKGVCDAVLTNHGVILLNVGLDGSLEAELLHLQNPSRMQHLFPLTEREANDIRETQRDLVNSHLYWSSRSDDLLVNVQNVGKYLRPKCTAFIGSLVSLNQPVNMYCREKHVFFEVTPTGVWINYSNNSRGFLEASDIISMDYHYASNVLLCGGRNGLIYVAQCPTHESLRFSLKRLSHISEFIGRFDKFTAERAKESSENVMGINFIEVLTKNQAEQVIKNNKRRDKCRRKQSLRDRNSSTDSGKKSAPVIQVKWSSTDRCVFYAAFLDGTIIKYNFFTRNLLTTYYTMNATHMDIRFDVCEEMDILVCGGVNGIVYFFEVSTGYCFRRDNIESQSKGDYAARVIFKNKWCGEKTMAPGLLVNTRLGELWFATVGDYFPHVTLRTQPVLLTE